MSWKPWQVWLALTWAAIVLVLTILYMFDRVPAFAIWLVTIVSGTVGAVNALLDRRARNRLLNQESA